MRLDSPRRRAALAAVLLLGLAGIAAVAVLAPSPARGSRVDIYYTASLDGHLDGCTCFGYPTAGLVKTGRFLRARDRASSLFLDAGDLYEAGPNAFHQPARPAEAAARLYRGNEAVREILHSSGAPGPGKAGAGPIGFANTAKGGTSPGPGQAGAALRGPSQGALRPAGHPQFLDWNPDLKIARELGVRIEYSSRTNEIRCPELRLSSRDRERGDNGPVPGLTSRGVTYESGGSSASGGSSEGGRSAASGSASGGVQGSTKEGSSSSGGGKIKN